MNKKKYNDVFMSASNMIAEKSHAKRLKVGCAVVKDNRIIALSYNGTPAGTDNICEVDNSDGTSVTKDTVLHAEENAIVQVAKSNESIEGSDMFVTHAPCIKCAARIKQAGIRKVYWGKVYRSDEGLQYLSNNGVEVERFEV